jgi:hypothetical protein
MFHQIRRGGALSDVAVLSFLFFPATISVETDNLFFMEKKEIRGSLETFVNIIWRQSGQKMRKKDEYFCIRNAS